MRSFEARASEVVEVIQARALYAAPFVVDKHSGVVGKTQPVLCREGVKGKKRQEKMWEKNMVHFRKNLHQHKSNIS